MAISLSFSMTERERTLKMPKPESRMMVETVRAAEMRRARKMVRLPCSLCCQARVRWERMCSSC